ncbi:uncharacterized protein LOC129597926 [Paramacrobiotus metropolitanus]|uniref:uncharacterized protein LOC129597926 n=1 Tax=Paramacrobiotus metropolitanus TaxID=2943436 RepID=UPI002445F618|nr:uncharacterized protein LOC129597926 [Paramacrobiotus metropolitanus]
MHLYKRAVYAWNAVDVEINGQLQHGYVIGLKEYDNDPPYLMIDFRWPVQQVVLVPYGRIWSCSTTQSSSPGTGADVEVLLRDGQNNLWKWYPGRMLIPCFQELDKVALVEVMIGGQCRRKLIPGQQIRVCSGDGIKPGLLSAGHFIKQMCSVPNGYWIMKPSWSAWLLRRVEREHNLRFFKILGRMMHYVRGSQGPSLTDEHLAVVFERERKSRTARSYLLRSADNGELDGEPKPQESSSVGEGALALPLPVLKKIFYSLDTVERQGCRRTCQLWEPFSPRRSYAARFVCRDQILPLPVQERGIVFTPRMPASSSTSRPPSAPSVYVTRTRPTLIAPPRNVPMKRWI